jgi:organic radical activating enzyme
VCTAFTGQEFFCDTDYTKHTEVDADALVAETHETTACFTGGEPLLHQTRAWYKYLYTRLHQAGKEVHIETSGTIRPLLNYDCLTVSPKVSWLAATVSAADQLKFLVTADLALDTLEEFILEIAYLAQPACKIFVSPVFDPNTLVQENLQGALELLKRHPHWRLSCQWHKFLNLR